MYNRVKNTARRGQDRGEDPVEKSDGTRAGAAEQEQEQEQEQDTGQVTKVGSSSASVRPSTSNTGRGPGSSSGKFVSFLVEHTTYSELYYAVKPFL